jgi:hypothetical protein
VKKRLVISKNYHSVKQFTYFNDDRKRYGLTGADIQTLTPQLTAWRRDFHHFAESGWVEFRTAAKVAEILDHLGYELAMGRDVVDAESRMGLPDAQTLAKNLPARASKARPRNGSPRLKADSPALSPRCVPGVRGRQWPFAWIWMRWISAKRSMTAIARSATALPPAIRDDARLRP